MRKVALLATALTAAIAFPAIAQATPGPAPGPSDFRAVPEIPADVPESLANQNLKWGKCLNGKEILDQLRAGNPAAAASVPLSLGNLQCATFKTPVDWENAGGPTTEIRISRVASKSPDAIPMIVNPGGPGGGGRAFAAGIAALFPRATESHDVIGMEPRGLNANIPSVQCAAGNGTSSIGDGKYSWTDPSDEALSKQLKDLKGIADSCKTKGKPDIKPYVNTWQTASDMNLIRAIYKKDKLDYYGVSYGTQLGATFASMYPGQTGRFILDSNTSWSRGFEHSWAERQAAMEVAANESFIPWIASKKTNLGDTPEKVRAEIMRMKDQLKTKPISFPFLGKPIGDNTVAQAIQVAVGQPGYWEPIKLQLQVLQAATSGPNIQQQFLAIAGQLAGRNAFDLVKEVVYMTTGGAIDGGLNTVACQDAQWNRDVDAVAAAQRQRIQNFPVTNAGFENFGVCMYWNGPQYGQIKPVTVPVLMVQNEFDPQTAYSSATAAREDTPEARLITVEKAATHGAGMGISSQAKDLLDAYLYDGNFPAQDVRVQPNFPDGAGMINR